MSAPRRVVFTYQLLATTLNAAQRGLAAGQIEERCTRMLKAQDIVLELLAALDHDQGPLAANLAALYTFWLTELSAINMRPDATRLGNIERMVKELLPAWQTAAEEVAQHAPAGAVA